MSVSSLSQAILPGIYRHYKGNLYEVIGTGRHSETHEPMVVYRALYDSPQFGNKAFWIRPVELFFEVVEVNGKTQPRFERVDDD